MINVMIVDDELLSVTYLGAVMNKIGKVKIVGNYTSTYEALTHMKREKMIVYQNKSLHNREISKWKKHLQN